MRLINKTDYDTAFLRHMLAWVRKEVGLRAESLKKVTFKHPRGTRTVYYHSDGMGTCTLSARSGDDRWPVEAAAHCLGYMAQAQDGCLRYLSGPVRAKAEQIMLQYSGSMRSRLRAAAMSTDATEMIYAKLGVDGYDESLVKPVRTKPTLLEKRASKAAADLARWERKLKLAKGKVAKLQKQVDYYRKKSSQDTVQP